MREGQKELRNKLILEEFHLKLEKNVFAIRPGEKKKNF